MYQEIGFEVHLEPFDAAYERDCAECMALSPDQFNTIYTRKKNAIDKK